MGREKIILTMLNYLSNVPLVLSDQVYPKVSLTAFDRISMEWVANNVPPHSRFVILTGETEAFADSVSEWFPVLGKSVSLATIQGYEWLPDKLFQKKMNEYHTLQICMNKTYTCVDEWRVRTEQDFDYVLVSQNGLSDNGNSLVSSLMVSETYRLLYREGDMAIFKRH
jgi:hypothetical protein